MRCALLIVAACGQSAPPSPHGPQIALTAPQSAPDDVQIATVNGRPVWGSCVAAQAARGATRDQARDQCIAFELLAQAAEARGEYASSEVHEALTAALVNRLVERDFEAHYAAPADLQLQIDEMLKGNEWRLHVPEIRASSYARFNVPASGGFAAESKAKVLAQELYDALANETGLYPNHLNDAAKRFNDPLVRLETADVPPKIPSQLVKPYADALFAIPEVGRVAPPVRTKWGWDVVLLTAKIPARDRSREEFAADVFPELRRQQFATWATGIAKSLGLTVEKHEELLESDE